MHESLIPDVFHAALGKADVTWQAVLLAGLEAVAAADPGYLVRLAQEDYLPTQGRLFAAFALPLPSVRYVLMGEGPYPRAESATGVCFMDGAVGSLWSASGGGLSKPVNRATSLRNFMKMLLVADGQLSPDHTGTEALAPIAHAAQQPGSSYVQTLAELQASLIGHGFLLLNAALVYRPQVAPRIEAKAWQPFMQIVLAALAEAAQQHRQTAPVVLLWGKIAGQLKGVPALGCFPQLVTEHPYNLSFINNQAMLQLFGPMKLLEKPGES